ncbi:MAG: glycosyl hydrolase family 65 protein [Balneolales bacterium]
MSDDHWRLTYNGYDPAKEGQREALFTLGNGYFASRGAAEESTANHIHYPGTYLAGGYNRLNSDIGGKVIEHEDLVNWPNWLLLKWKHEDGDWMELETSNIIEYSQSLDLRSGIIERQIHTADKKGRETRIISRRLVHMRYPHLGAIQWHFKPQNWSGNITVHSALDGTVRNSGVDKYRKLEGKHLRKHQTGQFKENGIYLKVETSQSETRMCQAAGTAILPGDSFSSIKKETIEAEEYIAQEFTFPVKENREVIIEKIIALSTSKDHAISDTVSEAQKAISRAMSFEELSKEQNEAWQEIWSRCDTEINCGTSHEQMLLRLHIFHLFQTLSPNSIDLDVGVPSRGWTGEAYWGHVLWDEVFIFPLMNLSLPELTRSLLMYRYRRLHEARHNALANGYKGAMYPWQSGSNGREETFGFHYNVLTGNWIRNDFQIQHHVNSAICYNVWQYFQVTGDYEFLSFYGAEIMLEIATFWASKATWSEHKRKYEINHIIGPDEYHTRYPGSDKPGINNNAYTNIMAIWVLKHARRAIEVLDERSRLQLTIRLRITKEELYRWDDISQNMFIPFSCGGKIITQFEGYDDLKELDWNYYKQQYGEILRLGGIMEKEGVDINRFKAAKQADVLMLFYLFSSTELVQLFETAGYKFDPKDIPLNIEYYEKRTSHGSTLSKVVNSWVMARCHRDKSWHNFNTALVSDFEDIQGGTTPEGIHLGAMAGTVDLIQRCYTGLEMREGALWFNPQLPDDLTEIEYPLYYRGHWIRFHLTQNQLKLTCYTGWSDESIDVYVKEHRYQLKKGEEKIFQYDKKMVKAEK